jgi:uncharacterized membrane protein
VSEGPSFRYLHYITLHSLDQKLVKMAVGCFICHINTKTYVQYNWSFQTRKYGGYTDEAVQKYNHKYTSVLSTYVIYTTSRWMSNFLHNKYSYD